MSGSGSRGRLVTAAAGVAMAAIFGFSFLFTRRALHHLAPADLLALRFALAAAAMTLLVGLGLVRVDLTPRRLRRLVPLAALQPVAYFLCETTGIKLTSSAVAGAIIGAIPVVVTLLAAVFLGERPEPARSFFIVLSALGVAIMGLGGASGGGNPLGLLLLVGAVLAAGFYSVLSRRLSREFAPAEMTLVMMWAGALVFSAISLAGHWARGTPFPLAAVGRRDVWIALSYLGLLSSVGAFLLVNFILGRQEAARSTAYTNLTTVISVLAGVLLLKESFSWHQTLAGILIVAGVWGANRG